MCKPKSQARKRSTNGDKPKLLSPDICRWGRGLPREGVGAKKFGMPLEAREIELVWRDIPGFCRDIPELPEKFEKKVGVQCLAPKIVGRPDQKSQDISAIPCLKQQKKAPCIKFLSGTSHIRGQG